jgi:hypothetical protein
MSDQVYFPQARAVLQVIFDGFAGPDDDTDIYTIPVLPKAVTVHRNSYKQADAWELTFDAGDLPFDPDFIRSGSAEIYLFQASGIEQARLALSRQDPLGEDPGEFRPRDPADSLALDAGLSTARQQFTLGNPPIVIGLFDDVDSEMSSSGRMVTISGQDYTAHLAAMQWPPTPGGRARKVPTGRRIDDIFREILAEADPTGRLRVEVRNIDPLSLPIVGASEVIGNRRGIPVEQDTSYWDVLYKIAIRHGLITFVDGLSVVLSRPQNLSAAELGRVLHLSWGRNIESLRLSRALGKEQVPTIVVQGFDPRTKKPITVEYPEGTRQLTSKSVKGDVKKTSTLERVRTKKPKPKKAGSSNGIVRRKDEFQIIPMYGVSDPEILRAAAQNLFHLIGRGERKVVLTTKDLRDSQDNSLLGVAAGSAVWIEFTDYTRELLANPEMPLASKIDHLLDRGYSAEVAEVIAEHFEQLQALRRPLRVREATFSYDDGALTIELELVDFVAVDGNRLGIDKMSRAEQREERVRKSDGSRLGLDSTPEAEAARLRQGRNL